MLAGYLSEVQQIAGPFLVVVPLSTVPNWIREFRKWAPQLNTIVYVGDGQSREVSRGAESWCVSAQVVVQGMPPPRAAAARPPPPPSQLGTIV